MAMSAKHTQLSRVSQLETNPSHLHPNLRLLPEPPNIDIADCIGKDGQNECLTMNENENLVQWVYGARNNQGVGGTLQQLGQELRRGLGPRTSAGWVPALALEACRQYVPSDARILDAGAGTGLVGKALSDAGYRNLTAIDMSPGMLEEARAKGVYRQLRRMVLGERLDFPDDNFDAVVSIGVLTLGHAPARSLDEMVRVTKPGGHVIFTLRPDHV